MQESGPVNPLDIQVGGGHYKNKAIQPIEYCMANGLNACESAVVKYITRWADKGGLEDLEKVKHYVDLLIKLDPRAKKLEAPLPPIAVTPEERQMLRQLSDQIQGHVSEVKYQVPPTAFGTWPAQAERV